jgi:hypothetical protein
MQIGRSSPSQTHNACHGQNARILALCRRIGADAGAAAAATEARYAG